MDITYAINFESSIKNGKRASVAIYKRRILDAVGKERTIISAVRAIQDTAGGFYRIDRCDAVAGTWLPWEPIADTEYRTIGEAKRAIRAWAGTAYERRHGRAQAA